MFCSKKVACSAKVNLKPFMFTKIAASDLLEGNETKHSLVLSTLRKTLHNFQRRGNSIFLINIKPFYFQVLLSFCNYSSLLSFSLSHTQKYELYFAFNETKLITLVRIKI